MLLSLVLERFVVAVIGMAIGSAVGIWLSRWVLGFLDVTLDGIPVVSPIPGGRTGHGSPDNDDISH